MYVLDKTSKQKNPLVFPFGRVSRTKTVNGLVVGQFMEKFESLPGHDHRLARLIVNKGEGNDRNIECVGYKENI